MGRLLAAAALAMMGLAYTSGSAMALPDCCKPAAACCKPQAACCTPDKAPAKVSKADCCETDQACCDKDEACCPAERKTTDKPAAATRGA